VDKHHKPASDNLKQRGRQNFPTTQRIDDEMKAGSRHGVVQIGAVGGNRPER
jgi:hypothetical protein